MQTTSAPRNTAPKVGGPTPWGAAQSVTAVGADGIAFASTSSHGGYFVPDALLSRISHDGRAFAVRWGGSPNWYEEDCAWAYVAVAFPELFPTDAMTAAKKMIWQRSQV